MNGGDSTTDLLLLRRRNGRFEPWSTLRPGGEDAEFFEVVPGFSRRREHPVRLRSLPVRDSAQISSGTARGSRRSKASRPSRPSSGRAGRSTAAPSSACSRVQLARSRDRNRDSMVYEWDGRPSRAADDPLAMGIQLHHFTVGDQRHFSSRMPEPRRAERAYRWDAGKLHPHQTDAAAGRRSPPFGRERLPTCWRVDLGPGAASCAGTASGSWTSRNRGAGCARACGPTTRRAPFRGGGSLHPRYAGRPEPTLESADREWASGAAARGRHVFSRPVPPDIAVLTTGPRSSCLTRSRPSAFRRGSTTDHELTASAGA